MVDAEIQKRVRELRERVDEVDRELILALSERARIVQEIMDLKAEAGAPIYDPKRERRSSGGWLIATQVRSTTPR
jgi:chorismate mutase